MQATACRYKKPHQGHSQTGHSVPPSASWQARSGAAGSGGDVLDYNDKPHLPCKWGLLTTDDQAQEARVAKVPGFMQVARARPSAAHRGC
jgi:hypothetical protein